MLRATVAEGPCRLTSNASLTTPGAHRALCTSCTKPRPASRRDGSGQYDEDDLTGGCQLILLVLIKMCKSNSDFFWFKNTNVTYSKESTESEPKVKDPFVNLLQQVVACWNI